MRARTDLHRSSLEWREVHLDKVDRRDLGRPSKGAGRHGRETDELALAGLPSGLHGSDRLLDGRLLVDSVEEPGVRVGTEISKTLLETVFGEGTRTVGDQLSVLKL